MVTTVPSMTFWWLWCHPFLFGSSSPWCCGQLPGPLTTDGIWLRSLSSEIQRSLGCDSTKYKLGSSCQALMRSLTCLEIKDSGQGYTLVGDLKATGKGSHPTAVYVGKWPFFSLLWATSLSMHGTSSSSGTPKTTHQRVLAVSPPSQNSWSERPKSSQVFAFFRKVSPF